ncbi:MAG: hypothetical protein HC860_14175 [Alkalinema sp. RU_4_3]|nr:hypothetical protein [Alkalinema sp. RU_4_3]
MTTLKTTTQQPQASIAIPSQPIEQPSAWMRYGTSPAELILSISFILLAQGLVNWSIAGIIYTLKGKEK